jgi:hypothetical protein
MKINKNCETILLSIYRVGGEGEKGTLHIYFKESEIAINLTKLDFSYTEKKI